VFSSKLGRQLWVAPTLVEARGDNPSVSSSNRASGIFISTLESRVNSTVDMSTPSCLSYLLNDRSKWQVLKPLDGNLASTAWRERCKYYLLFCFQRYSLEIFRDLLSVIHQGSGQKKWKRKGNRGALGWNKEGIFQRDCSREMKEEWKRWLK